MILRLLVLSLVCFSVPAWSESAKQNVLETIVQAKELSSWHLENGAKNIEQNDRFDDLFDRDQADFSGMCFKGDEWAAFVLLKAYAYLVHIGERSPIATDRYGFRVYRPIEANGFLEGDYAGLYEDGIAWESPVIARGTYKITATFYSNRRTQTAYGFGHCPKN